MTTARYLIIDKKDDVYLKIEADEDIRRELGQFFTFEVPGFKFMPQYRSRVWDGKIRLFSYQTGQIYVGLYPYILKWCEDNDVQVVDGSKIIDTKVDEKKVSVIYNGIDLDEYTLTSDTSALDKHGVDKSKPYVLFVGRITRQKGIIHLVNAIKYIHSETQIVLCAGAPDTEEIGREMKLNVEEVQKSRKNVIWIAEMLSKKEVIQLYSHAAVFCCPSIYEPFGIINIEAMACKTAVVASSVGGIKEVVVDGETGILVPLEQEKSAPFEASYPDTFSRDLANGINKLMADKKLRESMGAKGRKRVEDYFDWKAIAKQTEVLYKTIVSHDKR